MNQFGADFVQHAGRFFKRRAERHIENNLEFTLVIEGQHLEHDKLKISQRDGANNQQDDGDRQLDAHCPTLDRVEEGRQQFPEGGVKSGIEF